jgi:hypothetical protein
MMSLGATNLIEEGSMKRFIRVSSVVLIFWLAAATGVVGAETQRFTGEGSERTAVFNMDGPWTLDWGARSSFPLMAKFEMRLLDGKTGRVIGPIVQIEGTANGLRLFEESGSFSIEVVATEVNWSLEIASVSKDLAAEMKRKSEDQATLEDLTKEAVRRLPAGAFSSWRVVDASTLLLFADDGMDWRAEFVPPCPGLTAVTALSFVSPAMPLRDEYDSILLDDGTRCYFDRVVPTIAD